MFACSGLVLQAMFACHLCHAMPTALIALARFILLCPPPCSFHVCQDRKQQFASCKDCPVSSYNAGLQWRPACRITSTPPFTVLQGLPCRQPRQETAFVQPMRRCSLRPFKKGGGLGLHVSSRPSSPHLRFMSQRLHASVGLRTSTMSAFLFVSVGKKVLEQSKYPLSSKK